MKTSVDFWYHSALLFQWIVLIYFVVTDWVDLSPWNNIRDQYPSRAKHVANTLINLTPIVLLIIAHMTETLWLMIIALLLCVLWLVAQLLIWWEPYIFGGSTKRQTKYHAVFDKTYQFLPKIKGHPVVNADHCTLAILTLIMLICSVTYFLKAWPLV